MGWSWISIGMIAAGLLAAWLVFRAQTNYHLAGKVKVRIGINRFPDSLPILYAAQQGYLSPLDVEIHFLNWSQAYDYLFNGAVDVILGVRRISAALVAYAQRDLSDGRNLSLYQGYSILLPPGSTTLSYVEISSIADRLAEHSVSAIVKEVLEQLEGKTIYVMSWDTEDATVRLLSFAGVKANIKRCRNVEEDFNAFVSNSSGVDAFVGGITQRLMGRYYGCKELISEQHVELGLVERTGLVWRELPSDLAMQIELAWFRAVSEINQNESSQRKFVELMNRHCLPTNDLHVEFSLEDFFSFWNRWEKFASNESESRNLRPQTLPRVNIPSNSEVRPVSNVVPIRPGKSAESG